MRPDTTVPDPDDRGYADDPMQVERGATPDGRLVLYFTFGKPDAEPHAPRENDGGAARSPHPRERMQPSHVVGRAAHSTLDAGEERWPSPTAPLPEYGRGETRTPPRSLRDWGVGGEGACNRPPDAQD